MCSRLFCAAVLFGALGTAVVSCRSSEEPPPPKAIVNAQGLAPSSDDTASDVPIEALGSLEEVYVPLAPASLQSLEDALEQKGYGNVKGSDFAPKFQHVEASFGPAVAAFTTTEWIASQSMYQPMTVKQWLEAALEDNAARGVIINPGHPGQIMALSKKEIVEVLTWLPPKDARPMEIYVTQ